MFNTSWAKIPTTSTTKTVTFQRWWGSGNNHLTNPAIGVIHSAIILERFWNNNNNCSNIVTTSSFTPQDWKSLFATAIAPEISTPLACHTFVVSDWKVFEDSKNFQEVDDEKKNSDHPPFPIMNVVSRHPGDFAYNNHIYDAMRNSFRWSEILNSQKNISSFSAENNSSSTSSSSASELAKQQTSMLSTIEEERKQQRVNCLALHANCRLLPPRPKNAEDENGETGCAIRKPFTESKKTPEQRAEYAADAPTILDELSAVNMSPESPVIHFYPFQNNRRNVAYENENFFVLVNLKPVEKAGHLLVIPRKIAGCLGDVFLNNNNNNDSEKLFDDCSDAIVKSIQALNRRRISTHSCPCDGFSIVVQQGKDAGQTVAHLHIHVIALTKGEGLCSVENVVKSIDPDADKRSAEELEEEERKLRQPRGPKQMMEEAMELKEKYFV